MNFMIIHIGKIVLKQYMIVHVMQNIYYMKQFFCDTIKKLGT